MANDIFGYSFEDIQRAQQKKGRLQKTVDLSVPVTRPLMPGDMELLEKHGIDGLRAMQFFGVVDRLEFNGIVPKRNPRADIKRLYPTYSMDKLYQSAERAKTEAEAEKFRLAIRQRSQFSEDYVPDSFQESGPKMSRNIYSNPRAQSDYSYSTNDYRRKSIAELDYIIRDASEAAQAMRGMNSAAESKYLEQVADAETERARRRTKRNPRKQSYAAEFDSMMGRESFEGMMKPRETCNLCGGAAGSPGMKAYDARGRMIQGCVGEIHGEALTPATEYARWWSRPEANKLRAALRKGQSGKGYGDNATRKNPRRSATVHASDKYLLQIKHGAKWKTLHSASSPELLKEDAQVLRKAGLRSAMQVIKK